MTEQHANESRDVRQHAEPAAAAAPVERGALMPEELERLAAALGRSILLCQKEVLTLDEAAQYTGIKKSSLYKLTASKAIPHFKPNGKVIFFKRHALEQWMTSNPVATADDLNSRAQAHCMKNKKPISYRR